MRDHLSKAIAYLISMFALYTLRLTIYESAVSNIMDLHMA